THDTRTAGAPLRSLVRRGWRRYWADASCGRRGCAHRRHLLRLGSGAHRHLWRASGEERRDARQRPISGRSPASLAVRALYTIALRFALPFLVLRLWWRGRREPGYRQSMSERFGLYQTDRPEHLLWIHAVSVGEARAAEPLVRALNGALPDHRILITCTTAAGRETIKQLYGES